MNNVLLICVVCYVYCRWRQCKRKCDEEEEKKLDKAEVTQGTFQNKREKASVVITTYCIKFYFLNAYRRFC